MLISASVADPGFSRRDGVLILKVGAPIYCLVISPEKMQEIEKKMDLGERL